MDFLEIELAAIVDPLPDTLMLSAEEQSALHDAPADLETWLIAAGRVLRGLPPSHPAGHAVRLRCGDPVWADKGDDLSMVAEIQIRALGEDVDRFAETGALEVWALLQRRDDLESVRRALEELERRIDDEPTAAITARTLDALVRDVEDIDDWADRHELELLAACAHTVPPTGLHTRLREVEAPGVRSWWYAVASAARSPHRDASFGPLPKARAARVFAASLVMGSGAGASLPPLVFEHGLEVVLVRDPQDRWCAQLSGMAHCPGEGAFALRWTRADGAVETAAFGPGRRMQQTLVADTIVDAVEIIVLRGELRFARVVQNPEAS